MQTTVQTVGNLFDRKRWKYWQNLCSVAGGWVQQIVSCRAVDVNKHFSVVQHDQQQTTECVLHGWLVRTFHSTTHSHTASTTHLLTHAHTGTNTHTARGSNRLMVYREAKSGEIAAFFKRQHASEKPSQHTTPSRPNKIHEHSSDRYSHTNETATSQRVEWVSS